MYFEQILQMKFKTIQIFSDNKIYNVIPISIMQIDIPGTTLILIHILTNKG